ncbi:MAG: hypothetical protein KGO49_11480 [Gammaproteobacteria bacterium]|nr:hypothetical protein [Gammaproteobacteria bacterium]
MAIGSSLSAYELAERLQRNDSTREAGWVRGLVLAISLIRTYALFMQTVGFFN